MIITKYVHSCLLIQDGDITTLIDPGEFTQKEAALDVSQLSNLTYILITHEHVDHLSIEVIKKCIDKFPKVKIITNNSVAKKLNEIHIEALTRSDAYVSVENAPHEKLFDVVPPENSVLTINGRLTHPGDSLQITTTAEILALPITAPWGSTTNMVKTALRLKPKVIIPIHDFLWKDEVRKDMYQRLTGFFKQQGIDFRGIETGEGTEA